MNSWIRTLMTTIAVTLALLGEPLRVSAATSEAAPPNRVFDVYLDDRAMGTHRFEYSGTRSDLKVRSAASFIVKVAFVTVYSYEHLAEEDWQNGCLVGVESTTDTNEDFAVSAQYRDGALAVRTLAGESRYELSCPSTFAYWDPALRTRTELVSAQSGKRIAISWKRNGEVSMATEEGTVPALSWTLSGEDVEATIYYDSEDRWLGLDSPLGGERTLHYRPARADPFYPFD